MRHTELKILLIDHDRGFIRSCLKSARGSGWTISASDRINDVPDMLLHEHCQVCVVSDSDWGANGINYLAAQKKKTPELLLLWMVDQQERVQALTFRGIPADGVIIRPDNAPMGLIETVKNFVANRKQSSLRTLEEIFDLLHYHSQKISDDYSCQDFRAIALNGISGLSSSDHCGFIIRHRLGEVSDLIYELGEPFLGERLLAVLHSGGLDHHTYPFILQLENVMDAAVSTFCRKNKFKSILIVPLHRENYDLLVWAARNEPKCEFNHTDMTAIAIWSNQMAMAIERPAIYQDLIVPAGSTDSASLTNGEALLTATASQQPGICEPKRNYIIQNMQVEHSAPDVPAQGIRFLEKKRVITNGITTVHLTLTEARLFGVLWQRRNELASHIELVYLTHGYQVNAEEASKILRPVVSRLKKKLSAFDGGNKWITNVRGTGYIMGEL